MNIVDKTHLEAARQRKRKAVTKAEAAKKVVAEADAEVIRSFFLWLDESFPEKKITKIGFTAHPESDDEGGSYMSVTPLIGLEGVNDGETMSFEDAEDEEGNTHEFVAYDNDRELYAEIYWNTDFEYEGWVQLCGSKYGDAGEITIEELRAG